MCSDGSIEDVQHFIIGCPAYEVKRTQLLDRVGYLFDRARGSGSVPFSNLTETDKLHVILGKKFGSRKIEEQVDRVVKRFLSKCWNIRSPVTKALDEALGRTGCFDPKEIAQ